MSGLLRRPQSANPAVDLAAVFRVSECAQSRVPVTTRVRQIQ